MKISDRWQELGRDVACNTILSLGCDSLPFRVKNVPVDAAEVIGGSRRKAFLKHRP